MPDPAASISGTSTEPAISTWRDSIANAQAGIAAAREHRYRTFRAAAAAGLTRREIGEAAGLSIASIQKIVGKDERVTLDSPADTHGDDR